jgi:D-aminopeptidase
MNEKKIRGRQLGLPFEGEAGEFNAITDVPGVLVGSKTLISGSLPMIQGKGPIRTGITSILPKGFIKEPQPIWAGMYALNGNGEMTGSHWIKDGGYFIGPICITNTNSVGITHHASIKWIINQYKEYWSKNHLWAMPVVAETYDGVLNDINGQHVTESNVTEAINKAKSEEVQEGNCGGGTGMICYEFKGGTGTSSRMINIEGEKFTIATLVQANHGIRPWLNILGVPVGKHLDNDRLLDVFENNELGSIIVIIATDAPIMPHQLRRMAKRAALGVARGGSPGGNNSGDIFLAFSTANSKLIPQLSKSKLQFEYINDEEFDDIYLSIVQSVEESVINAMLAADDMETIRPEGFICKAINYEDLIKIMKKYGKYDFT